VSARRHSQREAWTFVAAPQPQTSSARPAVRGRSRRDRRSRPDPHREPRVARGHARWSLWCVASLTVIRIR
jgi:hypothetical protein